MMWKNFNVNYNYKNSPNDKTIMSETNMDCLMHVLSQLTVSEKVKCRLVCKTWKEAVDKLFSGQKSLEIIYQRKFDDNFCRNNSLQSFNTLIFTTKIKFQSFHQMLNNFPSIHTLIIQNIPLSDVMILVISTTCRLLSTISFKSCISKREDPNNNTNDINCDEITAYGWNLLINSYPFLKYLTLKNCGLTDENLESILIGFSRLKYLDITDNELITGSRLSLLGNQILTKLIHKMID